MLFRSEETGLEYNGTTLNTLFAQRRNLLRPSFLGMVRDILRFHQEAPELLARPGAEVPLRDVLLKGNYGEAFVRHYIVPMGAAIWSTDPKRMLDFPARFFIRFLANHGMLTVNDRPVWRTIRGGSARYVEKLTAGYADRIRLRTPVEWIRRLPGSVMVRARDEGAERYDAVFLACHSDQALRLLADPAPEEQSVLGAIPYQRNEAVLHTDTRLLPRRKLAWAAWNYHVLPRMLAEGGPAALTYNMNILQRLQSRHTFCVTLNRSEAIDPSRILKRIVYHHPLFTPEGVAAQARHRDLNAHRTYYCGAYWRFGFHEDGLMSALAALEHFTENQRAQRPLSRVA